MKKQLDKSIERYLSWCETRKKNPTNAQSVREYDEFKKQIEKERRDKRAEVLSLISPICKALHIIEFDYKIDDIQEMLCVNGTEINCWGNSSSAVVDELIGYLFVTRYTQERFLGEGVESVVKTITSNWLDDYVGI